jgi:hypothetical protein
MVQSYTCMHTRLARDLHKLTGDLRTLAAIILEGTDSMDPSHIDMLGRTGGLRWWKVAPDGTKRLYLECFELCILSQQYLDMAPPDVQDMVSVLEVSDRSIKDRMAEDSLAEAIAEDRSEREQASSVATQQGNLRGSTSQVTVATLEMLAFLELRRQAVPIDAAQLYATTEAPSSNPSATPPMTRKRRLEATHPEESEASSNDKAGLTSPQADMESEEDDLYQVAKRRRHLSTAATGSRIKKGRTKQSTKSKKTNRLPPGKKFYRWSQGRLRVYRNILGFDDEDMPASAFNGQSHELETLCTPAAADIRFCNFDLSIEEIMTVSIPTALTDSLYIHCELTSCFSTSLFTLLGVRCAGGLFNTGLQSMWWNSS